MKIALENFESITGTFEQGCQSAVYFLFAFLHSFKSFYSIPKYVANFIACNLTTNLTHRRYIIKSVLILAFFRKYIRAILVFQFKIYLGPLIFTIVSLKWRPTITSSVLYDVGSRPLILGIAFPHVHLHVG